MSERVLLYDTTLRDGMQGEGMSLSVEEKVRVAHALDSLGVQLIEAGFPSSNPKEEALFALLADESFEHAEVAAFGMTRRRGVAADEDGNVLVWTGSAANPPTPATAPERAPRSYTPPHLAEKILTSKSAIAG